MELPQRRHLRPRLWSGPLVVHAATAPGPHEDVESKDDAESEGSPERVGGEGAGWRWINWVRDGLRDGTIAVNAEGGWLHNIAGEAFVVVPDGLEAFATFESVAAKTVKNRVVRLGRHGERSSPSGSANTLRAELADGRRVEGMVFPWRFRSGMVTARQRLTVLWGCDGGEHALAGCACTAVGAARCRVGPASIFREGIRPRNGYRVLDLAQPDYNIEEQEWITMPLAFNAPTLEGAR